MKFSGKSEIAGAEDLARVADATQAIELPLLLEAIFQRYGYDFRGYAAASLKRRVQRAMREEQLATISAFQDRILHDPPCMARFLDVVSVDTTTMFRDPLCYRAFRDKVAPEMRQLPHLRIWHAGCSSGEEVYSMAILLHEEGLLEKSQLCATDMNPTVLEQTKEAIFPIRHMREYTADYQKAGGGASFSAYYTAKGESVIPRDFLRRNIVWAWAAASRCSSPPMRTATRRWTGRRNCTAR